MNKPQLPIDGKLGKQFKVTSEYGWRIHPVEKTKKHHNGLDLWGAAETIYIEAPFDGKVIYAGPSRTKKPDGEPNGFGYYVQILFKWDGEWFISTHAHMRKGSLKVKVGQVIEAGTVVGIMGTTGMSTGKHLHWEITKGKKYVWSANGKGYVHPLKFTLAAIAAYEAKSFASVETPENAPLVESPATNLPEGPVVPKKKIDPKPAAKKDLYKVKAGDSYWSIADKLGLDFKVLQKLNGNKALEPGDTIKLK